MGFSLSAFNFDFVAFRLSLSPSLFLRSFSQLLLTMRSYTRPHRHCAPLSIVSHPLSLSLPLLLSLLFVSFLHLSSSSFLLSIASLLHASKSPPRASPEPPPPSLLPLSTRCPQLERLSVSIDPTPSSIVSSFAALRGLLRSVRPRAARSCNDINEANVKAVADKMNSLGLHKLGYEYLNIDDCWCTVRKTRPEESRQTAALHGSGACCCPLPAHRAYAGGPMTHFPGAELDHPEAGARPQGTACARSTLPSSSAELPCVRLTYA